MLADAAPTYERVRAAVMSGHARSDALGAIAFHGLWQGLRVLLSTTTAALPLSLASPPATQGSGTHDRQLVRLLADMVLATQLEAHHAC